ncbi:C-X-C motif chemokine 10 [Lampris incognitus]|uniref:C-X-C motif chemokine 10 n=1 Tax=Lampris incognitus TaxID=2546036 RepID=UPI0024B5EADA|nr:C-X-C motif chemokine 10 [Lampris incognitus]
MSSGVLPLQAAVVLCCIITLHAFSMDGFAPGLRCHCRKTTSHQIPAHLFKKLEVIPPGAQCRRTEIIITKKNGSKVCVNPEENWISEIINRLKKLQRERRSQVTRPATAPLTTAAQTPKTKPH